MNIENFSKERMKAKRKKERKSVNRKLDKEKWMMKTVEKKFT